MIKCFSQGVCQSYQRCLSYAQDLGALIVRFWVASIFFASGLDKIAYWPGTIVTFKYQYSVPFFSPVTAAYMGTAMEFILPTLLVLGLGGRVMIAVFFAYNLICVFSFPFLWTAAGNAGLHDHINWGLLLMMLALHGPGRVSVDRLIACCCKR